MQQLAPAYDSMLAGIADNANSFPEKAVTLFSARRGELYDHDLVIIGRAVNGWTNSYHPGEFSTPELRSHIISELLKPPSTCPLQWVIDLWGRDDEPRSSGYNTRRSAFWRAARMASLTSNQPDDQWSSHLAWTNLYKVSPAETGNPSEPLAKVQLPYAVEILRQELFGLKPRRILFFTGLDWARPFVKELQLRQESHRGWTFVDAAGFLEYFDWRPQVCVARHPQGKPESAFMQDVVSAFQQLNTLQPADGGMPREQMQVL